MNDRGVSVTINYALGLAVTTILLSGLMIAAGGMLEDRREVAMQGELEVLGNRLAAGLMTADRLAQVGANEVNVTVSLPDRVAGSGYDIEISASADESFIVLDTEDPVVTANVSFTNTTPVESLSVDGGDVKVVLTADGELEVESA